MRIGIVMILELLLFMLVLLGCTGLYEHDYESIVQEYQESSSYSSKIIENDVNETKNIDQGNTKEKSELRLQEAVQLALQNNPDMSQAKSSIEQARAKIEQAKSEFWPEVFVYSEYSQGEAPSAYLFKKMDQRQLNQQELNFNYPGWYENVESGIESNWNIFNGGRDIIDYKMAKHEYKANRFKKAEVINTLKSTVIKSFLSTLASKDFVHIADKSIDIVKEQLEQTKARFRAGGALKSDVLSLKARLQMAKERKIRAKNRYSNSMSALANSLGLDADRSFKLYEPDSLDLELPLEYHKALVYALNNRPVLKKIRQELVKSRLRVDKARSRYLPMLDVRGKYYHDDEGLDYAREKENWTLAVVLNWKIFSGMSTKAQIRHAQTGIKQMLAKDKKTVQKIQLQVKRALLKLKATKARIKTAAKSRKEAQESLRIIKKEYKTGSSRLTKFLQAELDLFRSKVLVNQAYYDHLKAKAELGMALGHWDFLNEGAALRENK